jgi:hypothetical protein
MPGIINLIQSRHFHRRSSAAPIIPIFRSLAQYFGTLPVAEHVHFYDTALNVTYVVYRLDCVLVLATIYDGHRTEFCGLMDLIKALEERFCAKDLVKS